VSQEPIALGVFEDAEAKHPLASVSLGEVFVGSETVITIYVKNLEEYAVRDLVFDINRTDILLEGPQRLRPGEIEALTITWSPTKESIGIKTTINITGTLIIGAN